LTHRELGNRRVRCSDTNLPEVSAVGLSWRSTETPSFSFTVGGRVAASFNTAITADGSHRGTLLEFGPFVRMAYNFAGPARHAAVAAPGTAPQEKQTGHQVFFGYDRSDISPVAASTIRQAAEDTRRGRPANIQVTSVAASSDELALRRASAVRDELVKNGVAPTQISIAPRGESDPLVPTARGYAGSKQLPRPDHILKSRFSP
jgi:outer membrane protein OmpA-like peptidoglycan-associated protein